MLIYSEQPDSPLSSVKSRTGISLALLCLISVSTAVWADSQPVANNASVPVVATPGTAAVSETPPATLSAPATQSAPVTQSAPANQSAPATQSVPANQPTPTIQPAPAPTPVSVNTPVAPQPLPLSDFSPLALYNHADQIVKSVILILIFASLMSWSIWSGKTLEVLVSSRRMKKNLARLTGERSLYLCGELTTPSCEQMRQVALAELNHISGQLSPYAVEALKERVHARIQRIEAAESRRVTRGVSILATTSSVAPFIGLFGTVWGIMHSFISIAQSHSTNLSVVAPGIAEALFATALGLVVAIPAVILYNTIGRLITGYRLILVDAMTHTLCLLSHDLDTLEQSSQHILTSVA